MEAKGREKISGKTFRKEERMREGSIGLVISVAGNERFHVLQLFIRLPVPTKLPGVGRTSDPRNKD